MPMSKPLIVITRPLPQGERFADAVRGAFGGAVDVLVAPVMRIDHLAVEVSQKCDVIFSSANAVGALGQAGSGRVAYCVGERTALAAKQAGFATYVAHGSAKSLIELVLDHGSNARLVHIRGEHSRGGIAPTLRESGVDVTEVIAYRQAEVYLSRDVLTQISNAGLAIFPIFSPRTAQILSRQLSGHDVNCAVVALSDEIAGQVGFAKEIDVAPSISALSVIKCLKRHIAA